MLEKYNAIRRASRGIRIGGVTIGGQSPIAVQSMTNTDTLDIAATVAQVRALADAGCDIVRITAPTVEAAKTFAAVKEAGITVPLVADIHFDYRVALACVDAGVDKIRINPGNIGDENRVKAVADACRAHHVPIRIGVNGGSLEKEILAKYGSPTAEALAESAPAGSVLGTLVRCEPGADDGVDAERLGKLERLVRLLELVEPDMGGRHGEGGGAESGGEFAVA